ncbi:MAG: hypothetical protein A2283_00040 [Lentisphaerae bacterium RIFOXYA12_FULL_48_11]|nr:MAG: hypothetical protein A2283_00040 [Lentisphaerae bacterium RIFOXYA12_FULL_48_11]
MRTMNSVSGSLVVSALLVVFAGFPLACAADAEATLKQYVADLQRGPDDYGLREKIVNLARGMNPPPAVPEEARRHAVMGQTFLKDPQKFEDFRDAAAEFKSALLIAPWWLDLYLKLAVALKGAEQHEEAIRALKLYVATTSDEGKAREAQNEIYVNEAKMKRAQREKSAAKQEAAKAREAEQKHMEARQTFDSLSGLYVWDSGARWRIAIRGDKFEAHYYADGRWLLIHDGTISANEISGTRRDASGRSSPMKGRIEPDSGQIKVTYERDRIAPYEPARVTDSVSWNASQKRQENP